MQDMNANVDHWEEDDVSEHGFEINNYRREMFTQLLSVISF